MAPMISCKLRGQTKIDLQLAQWHNGTSFPEQVAQITQEDVLAVSRRDENALHALSAVLMARELRELTAKHKNFALVARTIKAWAYCRGIHANTMGYFGGIAWVLLVVKTCQLYPNAGPEQQIVNFFRLWTEWHFGPDATPVFVQPPEVEHHPDTTMRLWCLRMRPWNPSLNSRDGTHLAPIISPALPYLNVSYNVTRSSLCVMKQELARGLWVAQRALCGEARWDELFQRMQPARSHAHLLRVAISAASQDNLRGWMKYVEAKMRKLVIDLENAPHVKGVRPYPSAVCAQPEKDTPSCSMYVGLDFVMDWTSMQKPRPIKLSSIVDEFCQAMKAWTNYSNDMTIGMSHVHTTWNRNSNG